MKKLITQVRSLEIIENELNENSTGVLAHVVENEKVRQIATTYIYLDKNIYMFFNDEDELFQDIHSGSNVVFTILKYVETDKKNELEFKPTYSFLHISVSGLIKKIEDSKLMVELQRNYLKKYKKKVTDETDLYHLKNAVMIDSEEIQAFNETGG